MYNQWILRFHYIQCLIQAYVAYKERFHSQDINSAALDPQLAYAITATYAIAGTFQLLGLTSFTFAAAFIVILIWFLGHIQLITTMQLDGAFEYFKATMGKQRHFCYN